MYGFIPARGTLGTSGTGDIPLGPGRSSPVPRVTDTGDNLCGAVLLGLAILRAARLSRENASPTIVAHPPAGCGRMPWLTNFVSRSRR
jgi:hypothetical protein